MITSPSVIIIDAGQTWLPSQLLNIKPSIDVRVAKQQNKIWKDTTQTLIANANDSVGSYKCPYTNVIFTSKLDSTNWPVLRNIGATWYFDFLRAAGKSNIMDCPLSSWTGDYTGSMAVNIPTSFNYGMLEIFNESVEEIRLFGSSGQIELLSTGVDIVDPDTLILNLNKSFIFNSKQSDGFSRIYDNNIEKVNSQVNIGTARTVNTIRYGGRITNEFQSAMKLYCSINTSDILSPTDRASLNTYLQNSMT